jgi:hypothetical protein
MPGYGALVYGQIAEPSADEDFRGGRDIVR